MTDPYRDPVSGILRNSLGITDPDRLRLVEATITATALAVLGEDLLPGRYDLRHLQGFHRRIFGRIYPCAGEIRTVAIAKTDLFCLPHHIEPYAGEVFGQLAEEKQLRGLPRATSRARRFGARSLRRSAHPLLRRGERRPSLPGRQRAHPAGVLPPVGT